SSATFRCCCRTTPTPVERASATRAARTSWAARTRSQESPRMASTATAPARAASSGWTSKTSSTGSTATRLAIREGVGAGRETGPLCLSVRERTDSGSRTVNAVVDGDTPCELELDEATLDLPRGKAGLLGDLVRARGEQFEQRRGLPRFSHLLDAEREEHV